MSDLRASYPPNFRGTDNRGPLVPRATLSSSMPQRDPHKEPAYSVAANDWAPYAPDGPRPSGTYLDPYSGSTSPSWAYLGDRYS